MEKPEEKSLKKDTKGAVLLIAVFMSAFLVGALWYIIGIGDAAVYRQYMQDGADATAFASAVYHARGMNIIALINLIMAAVLAVLVAFKIAQVLLAIANVASCIAGAVLDPVCDLTSAAEEPFANVVNQVQNAVDKILRALNVASTGVALGMPWVAEVKAVVVANSYAPTVHGGFMTSTSMIPGAITGSNRIGLPVEDDDFSVLCKHAGQDVGEFVFLPFSFLPGVGGLASAVGKFAGGMVGTIVSTFPGYFCGGGSGTDVSSAVTGGKTPEDICKDREKQIKDEEKKSGTSIPFDEKKCEASVKTSAGSLGAGGSSKQMDGSGKSSKRVVDGATNGDDNFAIWAFDWGDLKSQSGAGKGVNIAGWGKATVDDPGFWGQFHFAKSEFYYEPKSDDGKKWADYKDDAMWNMRWRARLRRFRLPNNALGGLLNPPSGGGGSIGSTIMALLAGSVSLPQPVQDVVGTFEDGTSIVH